MATPIVEDAMRDLMLRRYVLNGMNASETGRQVGKSRMTVQRAWDALSPDEQQELKDSTNEDVARAWRAIEDSATFELMKRIPDAKTHDLVVIAGVAADKAMKYMGVADTTNITVSESADDIATKIQAILKGAKSNAQREAHKQCAGEAALPT